MTTDLKTALYENIQHILVQTLPKGWEKILLYGEVDSEQCYSFYYVFHPSFPKPLHSNELPTKTGFDEDLMADLLDELDDCLISLWEESEGFDDSPWTTVTLTFKPDEPCDAKYLKKDLSKGSLTQRQSEWEKKHL